MAYEIPQQLEYHERIMFGLTFSQLGYLFLFGGIGLIIFFKTSLPLAAKIIIDSLLGSLAVLFMFFKLGTNIKNYIDWLKFRKSDSFDKIGKYFGFQEIKDNFILANKKKIAVLRVTPINFSIKPDGEKEAIIGIFQKFLNSIESPIQIVMNTDTIDLEDYFKSLGKKIKGYKTLFDSHKNFLKSVVSDRGIMNRSFYIVIPESHNINIQIKLVEEKLKNLNLAYKRVEEKELKNILAKFFFAEETKILPELLRNRKNYIEINGTYNRVIYAHGYPRSVEAGFLDKIVSSLGNFDISLHINPYPIETMLINLNKELQKQRADLFSQEEKGIINPSLEIKFQDTRRILEELQKGHHRLFNVGLYINCKARTLEELDLLTKKVESELNSLLIIPKVANYMMAQGLKSVAPLGIDALKINRNVTTEALSAFFPFTSPFLQVDESGVWLGLNKNNIPIIRDIFRLSNPNGVILAQSGGGKSYFAKLLIARYLLNGIKVMVIDPQGEYSDLTEHFGGQRIDLSMNSKTMINPLDLMGHDYTEKRLSLMDLMPVMLGELSEPQKSFIDKALTKSYETKGIDNNPKTWDNEPPILSDVLEILEKMEKKAITLEKTTIRSLINRLSMYAEGVFSFLNTQTNINFDNNFVCFDIGGMPKQVKPVIMFLVLDYVYMKMRESLDRKLLIIDEAWSLLSRTEDAGYIFEIVKTCRKFNLGLLLINQEVEGLLASEAGKSVLANTSYTLLMRQKPAVIEQVRETFHLSKPERDYLLTANVGEGILLVDDEHTEIKVMASEEEHKIITTNADEIMEQSKTKEEPSKIKKQCKTKEKAVKKPQTVKPKKPVKSKSKMLTKKAKPKVSIKVDEYRGFYRHRDLNLHEIKYLLARKYLEVDKFSIVSGSVEKFLIKPRHNESVEHMFLIFDIAEYLERKGIFVRKLTTKMPDIVFNINDRKVAIEVETGTVYEKSKKQLFEKIKALNQNYDVWFFVIANKRYLKKYRKLGKTIDKRYLVSHLDRLVKKLKSVPGKPGLKTSYIVEKKS